MKNFPSHATRKRKQKKIYEYFKHSENKMADLNHEPENEE